MNIFNLPIHPSADIFPMVSKDDLQALSDDIKANGLIHPIITATVTDIETKKKVKYIIDGRNRLAACKLANIEPAVEHYEGNINSFITSTNLLRRDLSAGQKAMAYAVLNPEVYKRYPKDTFEKPTKQMLYKARTVIDYAPTRVDAILKGSTTLKAEYKEAIKIKKAAEDEENLLAELKDKAPDLAALVVEEGEEGLAFQEAWAAYQKRLADDKANRVATAQFIKATVNYCEALTKGGNEARIKILRSDREHTEEIIGRSIEDAIFVMNKFNSGKSNLLEKLLMETLKDE